MSSYKYIPWPDNDKPAQASDILKPIRDAIEFAYTLRRKNEGLDIPYTGHDIGEEEKACCISPHNGINAEAIEFALDHNGMDALHEILGLALLLGIEQGRRMERTHRVEWES